ncbi:hypothetical protein LTR08_004488 [Meristemomyces frigidus]|nr:hypothetical protein LTR08_004488 [Meristemomyces frigidus]
MKLILSTSNILAAGASIHRPTKSKSNAELIASLRANFDAHSAPTTPARSPSSHDNGNPAPPPQTPSYTAWTAQNASTLEIPALDFTASALHEERDQYDITLKLFYLPSPSPSTTSRAQQTREALSLVLQELHMPSIDLLILSFPAIYFDEDEACPDNNNKLSSRGPPELLPESFTSLLATWAIAERLHDEGLVKRLGVAEFGTDRLRDFVAATRVKPSVDQINLRDCCSVPKELLLLAKKEGVELLVHNDCSNVLPRGTVRELLGPEGAGILAAQAPFAGSKHHLDDDGSAVGDGDTGKRKSGLKRKSLHGEEAVTNGNGATAHTAELASEPAGLAGEVTPQWVVKYTAVVRNRGVVENKGYFAGAAVVD